MAAMVVTGAILTSFKAVQGAVQGELGGMGVEGVREELGEWEAWAVI